MQDNFVLGVTTDCERYWLIDGPELRKLAATPYERRPELLEEFDLEPAKISNDSEVDLHLWLDDAGGWGDLEEEEFQEQATELLDYYDNL